MLITQHVFFSRSIRIYHFFCSICRGRVVVTSNLEPKLLNRYFWCWYIPFFWCAVKEHPTMMPIFVLVSLLFLTFLHKQKKQKVRNLRYKGGNYNIRTSVEFVFSPSILWVNLLYRNRVLAEIMRKSLSAELRHGKSS